MKSLPTIMFDHFFSYCKIIDHTSVLIKNALKFFENLFEFSLEPFHQEMSLSIPLS